MDFTGSIINEFSSLPVFWWVWLIVAAGGTGVVNYWIDKRKGKEVNTKELVTRSLLAAYVLFILFETVVGRQVGVRRAAFIPFWSYSMPGLRSEILLNYFLFIPLGLLMFLHAREIKKAVLSALCLSAGIEIVQLIFCVGLFEFDDIIGNTIGSLIGAGIGKVVKRCF